MEPFYLTDDQNFLNLIWQKEDENLIVGFSTRLNGNLALHVGDDVKNVIKNRETLANKLHVPFTWWTSAEQIHDNKVAIITNNERGKGSTAYDDSIKGIDGMITNQPNILLTAFFADCIPVYFYAKEEGVIGLAHAGWKGTSKNIVKEMIKKLKFNFAINIIKLKVALGPGIRSCCYEVDEPVKNTISSLLPVSKTDLVLKPSNKNGHYQLDLHEVNKQLLLEEGVIEENILTTNFCTSCNNDLFFSHRKELGKTGRMAAWIGFRR